MPSDTTTNKTEAALPGERYVQLESGGPTFPAVVEATTWNGWLRPRFRRDTAETLIGWLNDQTNADPDTDIQGYFEEHTLITEEGEHCYEYPPGPDGRYAVGAGGWCWTHPATGDNEPEVAP